MTNRRSFFASVAALFAAKPILSCVPKSNSFASKYLNTALFAERDFRVPFQIFYGGRLASREFRIQSEHPFELHQITLSEPNFRIPFTIIKGAKSGGKCE